MKKLFFICFILIGCKELAGKDSPPAEETNQVINQGAINKNITLIKGTIYQPTQMTSVQLDLTQFKYSATLADTNGAVQCQIINHPIQAAEYIALKMKIDAIQVCQNTRPYVCPMIATPFNTFSLFDPNNSKVLVESFDNSGCASDLFSCSANVANEISALLTNKIAADMAACH